MLNSYASTFFLDLFPKKVFMVVIINTIASTKSIEAIPPMTTFPPAKLFFATNIRAVRVTQNINTIGTTVIVFFLPDLASQADTAKSESPASN